MLSRDVPEAVRGQGGFEMEKAEHDITPPLRDIGLFQLVWFVEGCCMRASEPSGSYFLVLIASAISRLSAATALL
jgi:hypothetical protein